MLKKRFEQRLNSLSSELWTKIAQIDELKGRWIAGIHLSTQVLGRLKRSILITSTGASTRIEGARLSDDDIEKLMRGLDIQKFTDRDKQEVKGYFELLENVFNSWKSIKHSESVIKHFHKDLLKYVQKDKVHRGEYKKIENKVHMIDKEGQSIGILFDTTKAYLTPKEMQELVEWTQSALLEKKNHPLLIIANFIVEFLQIYPFRDGNGRLSRILTNLLLLKTGYLYMPYVSHEKLIEDNKPDYYMALRKSQKTFKTSHETIIPWLDFFLEILLQQSKAAIALLSEENIEKILSVKQLAVWQYIQTVNEATPKEIVENTKISRPTINQILDKLIRLKKIERLGQGRSTRYRKL
jgi:Fic family protein